MTQDYILKYWIEAVETALEEIDKLHNFTNAEIKDLAENLQISAEQESMAFGRECIPNPLQTEIQNLKAQHKKEIEVHEHREYIYRKNVSDRHGPRVDPNSVYIERNEVLYDIK